MYAMLAFILALITWYQTVFKSKAAEPKVVVNNYFTGADPFKEAGRNDQCPCGSGLKFKKCHGA
ncbi:SEC-C domain-containing protein [Pseudoalteromonas sp. SG41-2]|nr:SEC-C domain-containing protein [Pseudoalteromonas sp. SG41-2]